MLEEVRDRDDAIKELLSQKKRKQKASYLKKSTSNESPLRIQEEQSRLCESQSEIPLFATTVEPLTEVVLETVIETEKPKRPVPYVRVYDYEELKREAGLW